jgi:hypothetical protein
MSQGRPSGVSAWNNATRRRYAAHKPNQLSSSDSFLLVYDSKICYHSFMNKRQRATLDKIFQTPVPSSLEWRDIEALFLATGARTVEGSGSRVRFELNGVVATFHRPHPEKEAKPYQVRDARRFLEQAGIKP